jgi:hypothetical protein
MRPIWIGGLIAPLAVPLVIFFATNIFIVASDGWSAGAYDLKPVVGLIGLLMLSVSYLATWLLGVPYILWLRSKSRLTRRNVSLGAVLLGVVSIWVIQLIGVVGTLRIQALGFGAIIGAVLGFCVAVSFCWIVQVPRRHNPPC